MGDRPGIAMTALDVFAFYQICNMLACVLNTTTVSCIDFSSQICVRTKGGGARGLVTASLLWGKLCQVLVFKTSFFL